MSRTSPLHTNTPLSVLLMTDTTLFTLEYDIRLSFSPLVLMFQVTIGRKNQLCSEVEWNSTQCIDCSSVDLLFLLRKQSSVVSYDGKNRRNRYIGSNEA